jgi:hypothetical protein
VLTPNFGVGIVGLTQDEAFNNSFFLVFNWLFNYITRSFYKRKSRFYDASRVISQKVLRQAFMKSRTREEIRQEMVADYGQKSRLKIVMILFACQLLRLIVNNWFVALFTIALMNVVPFILCLLIGHYDILKMSILISLPMHYVLFWKAFHLSQDQREMEQVNGMLKMIIQELWKMVKKR